MSRWFVHLVADDPTHAIDRVSEHGTPVDVRLHDPDKRPEQGHRGVYVSAEVSPPTGDGA